MKKLAPIAAFLILVLAAVGGHAQADPPVGQAYGSFTSGASAAVIARCAQGQSSAVVTVDNSGSWLGTTAVTTAGQDVNSNPQATASPYFSVAAGSSTYANTLVGPGKLYVSLGSDAFVYVAPTAYTSGSANVSIVCTGAVARGGAGGGGGGGGGGVVTVPSPTSSPTPYPGYIQALGYIAGPQPDPRGTYQPRALQYSTQGIQCANGMVNLGSGAGALNGVSGTMFTLDCDPNGSLEEAMDTSGNMGIRGSLYAGANSGIHFYESDSGGNDCTLLGSVSSGQVTLGNSGGTCTFKLPSITASQGLCSSAASVVISCPTPGPQATPSPTTSAVPTAGVPSLVYSSTWPYIETLNWLQPRVDFQNGGGNNSAATGTTANTYATIVSEGGTTGVSLGTNGNWLVTVTATVNLAPGSINANGVYGCIVAAAVTGITKQDSTRGNGASDCVTAVTNSEGGMATFGQNVATGGASELSNSYIGHFFIANSTAYNFSLEVASAGTVSVTVLGAISSTAVAR